MKSLLPLILCFTLITSAQEKPKNYEFQDSLMSVSLLKNIKLTDRVSLRPGLTVRKRTIFNTFETPIMINYQVNDTWKPFIGVSSRFVLNSNFPELEEYFEKPSKVFISAGSEFQFDEKKSGHFSINFPLEMNLGFKF